MPSVHVDQEDLFKALGRSYTVQEFRDLCFDFGIELEDVTSEREIVAKEQGEAKATGLSEKCIMDIDIPANRYDLLCPEGIAKGLAVFQEKISPPLYRLVRPNKLQTLTIKPETASVRPHIVCAVLRGISFTQQTFDNFIELQEKLHNNLCRKRTLVAIGTHDLDHIQGPFTYEALPPKEICFIALNQEKALNAQELFENYEKNDKRLAKYAAIIKDQPLYPVIYDANRTVLSLPPVINGNVSKMSVDTKNIFIDCTATDLNKAKVALNTLVTAFSQYCEEPWTVEPVQVILANGESVEYPDLSPRPVRVEVSYVNSLLGLQLRAEEIATYAKRMCLGVSEELTQDSLTILVPPTRSDVLHPCDVVEDIGIAYGFNNLPKRMPTTITVGASLAINKLSDAVRKELAMAGWTEVLPFILCSHDECFAHLRRPDDHSAVVLANPKTIEYQVVRTSLLPGLLKSIHHNRKHPLPLRIFEVSDIVLKDANTDVKARNHRRVCAIYSGKTSGFETIQGLLNHLMRMLNTSWIQPGETGTGYFLKETTALETFFPGRCAEIYLRYRPPPPAAASQGGIVERKIGAFGMIHPEVLKNFDVDCPCSSFEFDLELFL